MMHWPGDRKRPREKESWEKKQGAVTSGGKEQSLFPVEGKKEGRGRMLERYI